MQEYEVSSIIDNIPYMDRNTWEQHRFQCYTLIQMNTKKKINPTDIFKFAWDVEEETTSIDSVEIERLKNKSQEIFKAIQNGK